MSHTLSPGLAKVAQRFLEALFPVEDEELKEAIREFPAHFLSFWDLRRFDTLGYRLAIPWLLRIFNLLPIFLFFYLWKPLPFTWLSQRDRERFLEKLEQSRIYGIRGLFVALKLIVCLVFFEDPRTFKVTGYDGRGMNPQVLQMGSVAR